MLRPLRSLYQFAYQSIESKALKASKRLFDRVSDEAQVPNSTTKRMRKKALIPNKLADPGKVLPDTGTSALHIAAISRAGRPLMKALMEQQYVFDSTRASKKSVSSSNSEVSFGAPETPETSPFNVRETSTGKTPLMLAALRDNSDVAKELLTNKDVCAGLTLQDSQGKTALHFACEGGSLEIVGQLLTTELGRECLLMTDKQGRSPLSMAFSKYVEFSTKAVSYQVKADEYRGDNKIHSQQFLKQKSLEFQELAKTYLEIFKTLISQSNGALSDEISRPFSDGRTFLSYACQSGDYDLAELLIQHGDPSQLVLCDNDGWDPLMYAIADNHSLIAEMLLEKIKESGQELEAEDCHGQTALTLAARFGRKSVLHKLVPDHPELFGSITTLGYTPLMEAVLSGEAEVVQYLLYNQPEITSLLHLKSVDTGQSALMMACELGRVGIVKQLLEYSDPGVLNQVAEKNGQSALMYAISKISPDNNDRHNPFFSIVELLVKAQGINLHLLDSNGKSALDMAKEKNLLLVIEALVRAGANEVPPVTNGRPDTSETHFSGFGDSVTSGSNLFGFGDD